MTQKRGIWPRILISAAIAVGFVLLGILGRYVFRGAGGFGDLFLLVCVVLSVLFGLVAIVGALRRLVTR
jgi:hypothetical protein